MQENKMFDYLTGSMAAKRPAIKRPLLVTLLCVALFITTGTQILIGLGMLMANEGLTIDKLVTLEVTTADSESVPGMPPTAPPQQAQEDSAASLPPSSLAFYVLAMHIVLLISAIGLWRMRKWSPFLYVAPMMAHLTVLYVVRPEWLGAVQTQPWPPLLALVAYIAIVGFYWKQLGAVAEVAVADATAS